MDDKIQYYARWSWCEKRVSGDSIATPSRDEKYVQWFHWMLISLGGAKNKYDIDNIFSSIRNYLIERIKSSEENIMINCMKIWSFNEESKTVSFEQKYIRASLFTLLNILPQELRAETIRNIKIYTNLLFDSKQAVLSVFPGVNSPGIMALDRTDEDSQYVEGAKRYDFYESDDEIVDQSLSWRKLSESDVENVQRNRWHRICIFTILLTRAPNVS